ncbi:DNA mismatch repair protein MutT [Bacillus cereus]|nr:DNA mismatch repair protein MutT [Bacillus cereus]
MIENYLLVVLGSFSYPFYIEIVIGIIIEYMSENTVIH